MDFGIDACIASLVKAIQEGGIDMLGSCCGHGKREGHIWLADGRGLLVLSPEDNRRYLAALSNTTPPIIEVFELESTAPREQVAIG